MTDPNTAVASSISIAAFAIMLLGPHYGPYAAILFAAAAGAIWGVSAVDTDSRKRGALLFLRYTMTGVVLVGGGTALAEEWFPGTHSPLIVSEVVAFGVAAIGDQWKTIISRFEISRLWSRGEGK